MASEKRWWHVHRVMQEQRLELQRVHSGLPEIVVVRDNVCIARCTRDRLSTLNPWGKLLR
jgi:hypothetical protein